MSAAAIVNIAAIIKGEVVIITPLFFFFNIEFDSWQGLKTDLGVPFFLQCVLLT